MSKKQLVAVTLDEAGKAWLSVTYPTIGKTFRADLTLYAAGVREQAMYHGFKQKFGDAESGGTPAEKFAMVQRIHANLLDGNWELVSTPDNTPTILEAVSRVKGISIDKIEASFKKAKATDEQRAAKIKEWGTNAKVKAEVAKIRAERAAKIAEDTDEDLDIDLK